MDTTEVSASGIRSSAQAVAVADGFARMHTADFAVLHYPLINEFDVELAKPHDTLGENFVAYIAHPSTEEPS